MTVEGGYHTRCSSPTGPRRLSASLSPCRSAGNKRSMSPGGRRGSGRGNGSSEARPPDCVARLDGAPPWVREPLVDWLAVGGFDGAPPEYRYLVEGDDISSLTIHRVD